MSDPIDYLQGGERPTAERMSALFEAFDTKLSALLAGGASPLLAQLGNFPASLMGNVFFFLSDYPVYAGRAPGEGVTPGGVVVDPNTGLPTVYPAVVHPYDHAIFEAALEEIEGDVVWDEVNKVATIPRIDADSPASLTCKGLYRDAGMGLFEHSLAAHFLMHQGESDAEPAPYYVRDGAVPPPEKHLKFAVAEIVIEGPTAVDLPEEWDKYHCFRLHNCNAVETVVTFGESYTITLPPWACRTVRRDSATTNYRQGWNYFFKFEPGDPRFFWFLPTDGTDIWRGGAWARQGKPVGGRAANGMAANNLTNPVLLYDWINFFSVAADAASLPGASMGDLGGGVYARFLGDPPGPSDLPDAYPLNRKAFGDPGDPETLLGDLFHHKGRVVIVRTSKTETETDGSPRLTFDHVEFNGYATLVEDFAAKQLAVAENGDGDLVITNADADHWVDLIAVGTNLFKRGDSVPVRVGLNDAPAAGKSYGGSTPYTLENAVFEAAPPRFSGQDFVLSASAPSLVFQRELIISANTRTWYDFDARLQPVPVVVPGPDLQAVGVAHLATRYQVLHGLHHLTVADLMTLHWWGNPDLEEQDTPYGTFTGRTLRLTPEGLVLTYDETILASPPPRWPAATGDNLSGDYLAWARGDLVRPRAIRFRGHGWGYVSPTQGSRCAAFLAPRHGAFTVRDYLAEVTGVAGSDFGVRPLRASEAGDRRLRRLQASALSLSSVAGRFWKAATDGGALYLQKYATQAGYHGLQQPEGQPFRLGAAEALNGMTALSTGQLISLPLLPEHYNGLAMAVNSLKRGYGLTAAALSWRLPEGPIGTLVSLAPVAPMLPLPMNCYAAFSRSDPLYRLCELLRLPIRTRADLPDNAAGQGDTRNINNGVYFRVGAKAGAVPGAVRIVNMDTHGDGSWNANVTVCFTQAAGLAVGTLEGAVLAAGGATGPNCQGVWTPGVYPPDSHGYYVVGADGKSYVTSNGVPVWDGRLWCRGDLLFSSGAWGWGRISLQTGGAGAASLNGGWVQVAVPSPSSMGLFRCLGDWTPNATLPSAGEQGDYYAVAGESGPGMLECHPGQLLCWNTYARAWTVVGSDYDDFYWITVEDVTAFLGRCGFKMLFNELVTPLKLEHLTGGAGSELPGSRLNGTVELTLPCAFNWEPGFGGTAAPTATMIGVAAGEFAAALASGQTVGESEDVRPAAGGAQLRFQVSARPTWKLRSSVNSPAALANVKNWQGDPPCLVAAGYGPAGGAWPDPPGGFYNQCSNRVYIIYGAALGLSFCDWPPLGSPTVCGGVNLTGVEEFLKGPVSEGVAWQYQLYGLYAANSPGVVGADVAQIAPTGCWNWDGDWWALSDLNLAKSVASGDSSGLHPSKWFEARGTPSAVTAANGLALIAAPVQSAAFALFRNNLNLLTL